MQSIPHHEVVVGVVINAKQEALIAERPSHTTHAGCLEFPGGKCEPGEKLFDALCRELREEVGIQVLQATPFMIHEHDYGNYRVTLNVWLVTEFLGEASGCEGQSVCWQAIEHLDASRFPAGNVVLIEALTNKLVVSRS